MSGWQPFSRWPPFLSNSHNVCFVCLLSFDLSRLVKLAWDMKSPPAHHGKVQSAERKSHWEVASKNSGWKPFFKMTAIPVRCSLPLFPSSDTENMPLLRPLFEKLVWPIKNYFSKMTVILVVCTLMHTCMLAK